jgi:Kef-type K+ transport system membrane component KefB
VFIAGIELDMSQAWKDRKESTITAGLAMLVPLIFGGLAASLIASGVFGSGWIGTQGHSWQFVMGVAMACAVTALPILILLMEKMGLLRQPIGQRILRYASLDDIAIWGVLALILMDWERVGKQVFFFFMFAVLSMALRRLMQKLPESDRWYAALIWLIICALGADWSGLHYMVGAFLAGVVIESKWFDQKQMDFLRHHVLLVLMPVFFLSTGLRTNWSMGGVTVFWLRVYCFSPLFRANWPAFTWQAKF